MKKKMITAYLVCTKDADGEYRIVKATTSEHDAWSHARSLVKVKEIVLEIPEG